MRMVLRMIKKMCAVLICACLCFFAFVGCNDNSDSEIVGKWVPATANINGETVQYSDLDLEDGSFYFEFKSNGSFSASIAGIHESGEYVFNDTSVDLILDDETQKMTYDNGSLTYAVDYGNQQTSFTFVKQVNN